MTESNARTVERVVTAHRQTEGGGFIVRRPFPAGEIDSVDPFLLLDEMGPITYGAGEALGAPDHPHRGFVTVTYMLEGEFEHADSAGHRGRIGPGDVQWMTAGRGIVHSEMPSRRIQEHGGRVHGFQIWVNLPAKDKMIQPRYQEIRSEALPILALDEGRAQAKLIAGGLLGTSSRIDTQTPIVYHDWTLHPGGSVEVPYPEDLNLLLYVFQGALAVGTEQRVVGDGQMAILSPGSCVVLRNQGPGSVRFLLLGGEPLEEPVARYGPFVMNTQAEIRQAVADFQSGRLAQITRDARTD
ncbi:MAG TPA: pirin family protein [Arenimonas sp.]|uniref:pirin family protein n=1 Tax=Arenimonas sp. TaxID=1872635 RepID=UPI002D7E602B|nr:pirin family protein [Arenimonas sp.]HEU0153177.1 pirin family protein [Arenimonas sp.]